MRRRVFLGGVGMAGMGSVVPALGAGAWGAPFEDGADDCGVASGEPAPDAVTIWTRVPAAARAGADGVALAPRADPRVRLNSGGPPDPRPA